MSVITAEKSKSITFNGSIKVDGTVTGTINASIDSKNPDNISGLTFYVSDQKLYKENRAAIKGEIEKFENEVYAEQDKMIAAIVVEEGGNK